MAKLVRCDRCGVDGEFNLHTMQTTPRIDNITLHTFTPDLCIDCRVYIMGLIEIAMKNGKAEVE